MIKKILICLMIIFSFSLVGCTDQPTPIKDPVKIDTNLADESRYLGEIDKLSRDMLLATNWVSEGLEKDDFYKIDLGFSTAHVAYTKCKELNPPTKYESFHVIFLGSIEDFCIAGGAFYTFLENPNDSKAADDFVKFLSLSAVEADQASLELKEIEMY